MKFRIVALLLALLLVIPAAHMEEALPEAASGMTEPAVEEQEMDLSDDAGEAVENGAVEEEDLMLVEEAEANPHEIAVAINDTNFPSARMLDFANSADVNHDGKLTIDEILAVKTFFSISAELTSMKGLEYFVALEEIHIEKATVSEMDFSKNTKLNKLELNNNPNLTAIDISANEGLKSIDCTGNKLGALDVTHNPELAILACDDNPIGALDVTHNPELVILACNDNPIGALDVTQNPKLAYLYFNNTKIETVDLSQSAELKQLEGMGSKLKAVDLSHCPKLEEAAVSDTHLEALDVSQCPEMETVMCSGARVKSLNLSANTKLRFLECFDNPSLTSVTLSPSVFDVQTYHCPALTTLDVRPSQALVETMTGGIVGPFHDDPEHVTEYYRTDGNDGYLVADNGLNIVFDDASAVVVLDLSAAKSFTVYKGDMCRVTFNGAAPAECATSSKKLVTLTQPDMVETKGVGKAKITARNPDTGKKVKFTLIIKDPAEPVGITIDPTNPVIKIGENRMLHATMEAAKPDVAPVSKLTWKSSKTGVLAVNKTTGALTPKKAGAATITVKTANKLSTSVTLTVVDPRIPVFLSIDSTGVTPLNPGDQRTLQVAGLNSDGEIIEQASLKLKWKSSKSSIVSVKNGAITAKKTGEAVITATSRDNKNVFAQITITVN